MPATVATTLAIRGDRKALARAIAAVCGFVPAKGTVPIHATARVEGTPRGLLLVTGADFAAAAWVEVTVDQCEVEGPGLAHVPASQLNEMMASAAAVEGGDGSATIEEVENGLIIKAKPDKGVGVRYRLGIFAEMDDWQAMPPRPTTEPTFKLRAADLAEALKLVSNAADDKKGRWLFNAIHFVRSPEGLLRVIATDRKWLSFVDCLGVRAPDAPAIDSKGKTAEEVAADAAARDVMAGAALDVKAVKIVQRLAAADTSEWSVWVTKDVIQFEGGGARVACRPLNGNPPPFDAVIGSYQAPPDGVDSVGIEFTRRELERVVQSAALVIAPRADKSTITTAVTFALSGDAEKVPHVAKVRDPDGGEADIGMDVSWSGADYATSYSSEVLPKALKTLPDGPIKGVMHWMRRKLEKGPRAGTPFGSPLVVDYKRSETMRHFLLVMPLDPGA